MCFLCRSGCNPGCDRRSPVVAGGSRMVGTCSPLSRIDGLQCPASDGMVWVSPSRISGEAHTHKCACASQFRHASACARQSKRAQVCPSSSPAQMLIIALTQRWIVRSNVLLIASGSRPALDPFGPFNVDYQGTVNLVTAAKAQDYERVCVTAHNSGRLPVFCACSRCPYAVISLTLCFDGNTDMQLRLCRWCWSRPWARTIRSSPSTCSGASACLRDSRSETC